MALSKSAANKGQKTHHSKPSSTLSKQAYIVKPESRQLGKKMSVSAAQSFVNKIHS